MIGPLGIRLVSIAHGLYAVGYKLGYLSNFISSHTLWICFEIMKRKDCTLNADPISYSLHDIKRSE